MKDNHSGKDLEENQEETSEPNIIERVFELHDLIHTLKTVHGLSLYEIQINVEAIYHISK